MGITVAFLFIFCQIHFICMGVHTVFVFEVYLLCNSRFPRAMSFKFIPLMAEVHKALLYKDNEAWHFLEISANGSSLIFHKNFATCSVQKTQLKNVYL